MAGNIARDSVVGHLDSERARQTSSPGWERIEVRGIKSTPQATTSEPLRAKKVGFAAHQIPLILTFSHPGEGTRRPLGIARLILSIDSK